MKCLDGRSFGAAWISVLMAASGAVASPVYVDLGSTCIPATQTCGATWATAYPSLQPAIDEAGQTAGTEVWVAQGKYTGPFTIPDAVKIYGGFAGTETLASQARPGVYVTRISGGSPAISTTATGSATVLRGFHIRGGSLSTLTGTPNVGAGLFLQDSSLHVIDCVFSANTSTFAGGAVGMEGASSPVFENCVFSRNNGGFGGGAVGVRAGSPTFINCLFDNNEASEGGAVVNFDGTPTFINCTFVGNTATEGSGGGLFDSVGMFYFPNQVYTPPSGVVDIFDLTAAIDVFRDAPVQPLFRFADMNPVNCATRQSSLAPARPTL